jgi:hypothetical protein
MTSEHEQSSEDTAEVEQVFAVLLSRINETSRSIHSLKALLNRMSGDRTAFDDEDIAMVSEKLRDREAEHASMNTELERRQHLYSNTVQRLQTALSRRERILEEIDSETQVLENHPDLLERLTQKQVDLARILRHMRDKLGAPIESPPIQQ